MQDWPLGPFEATLKQGTGPLSIVPHDPPTSDNFCLLFHTTAHNNMKIHFDKVCQNGQNYHRDSNRKPRLFFVENCLGLQRPLDDKSFKELVNYIKHKNSTETLSYYEGEGNYYITAEFKVTIFFLFAKLKQMGYHNTQFSKQDFNLLKDNKKYKIVEAPYHV